MMLLIVVLLLCIAAGFLVWYVVSLFREPDYVDLPAYYPFKSEKKKEKYLQYYDNRSKEWPVQSETTYVETSSGKTFVRISGPVDAPPLVLLPSGFASSLVWIPNIASLARCFRVYAVDNIYDVGRSRNARPIKHADDLVHWMDELFTALDLRENINLMGLSFGGWLTGQYALRYPDRLHGIVMAAPVATVLPLPGEWAWRGILGALPNKYFMSTFLVNWMFQDLVKKNDAFSKKIVRDMTDDAMMGLKCFQFRMPVTPFAG